jgi:hypothetical protein
MGLFSFLFACGLKEKKMTDDKSFFKSADKRKQEQDYLDKNVFYGLTNLNDGFDAAGIKYFSEKEFEIVLDRVRLLGLGITGIEPWKDGEFYGVETYEEYASDPTDSTWYLGSFDRFKKTGDTIQYAATYSIPDKLLSE